MKRSLLRSLSLYARAIQGSSLDVGPWLSNPPPYAAAARRFPRHCSSESSGQNPTSVPESSTLAEIHQENVSLEAVDVNNKEMKELMEKYFKGDEEALPSIMDAILRRKLSSKHEETDDELMDELRMQPLDDVKDKDFESDFEELYKTDEEIDDLYNASELVVNKMAKDEYFNMDDKKWDEMVKEAIDHGFIKDTKECEEILEDMLSWDKLLPDDVKEKVEKRFNELGDMCERGEIEPEEAYELFKKFEDEMVMEYGKRMEAEGPPQFDETAVLEKKKDSDDPPGEGPILRWQTRVVFAPGGDAWHPKNRKVKLSVTVKELGLSKSQFKRLRELVGKRYHPGKDELTITSERFEHREENRKDCLRTLFSIIEEAGKANKMAEDARVSYLKDRLRANPSFMDRLRDKVTSQRSKNISA
ncbi:hypothetical protein K2173_026355 [Erythroxylum novogranatense]|uniref:Small ribosomal subunit protein mS35 mitochondrial conserved domain-containing protein n=1 Tax=Erythroxylum novogranatense TaxID=1862640 RepID=A0AAV8SNW4_9ROSI|nr:hypothetical protein K2173_026355 [Erythroxylum novogranatense]